MAGAGNAVRFWLLLPAVIVFHSGCSEGGCIPCGESCPDLKGEYYLELTGLIDTCSKLDLPLGAAYLKVIHQTVGVLELELRDNRGAWNIFEGILCNVGEGQTANVYAFSASCNVSAIGAPVRTVYSLDGSFTWSPEENRVVNVGAQLTWSITDTNVRENSCVLVGDLKSKS